MTHPRFTFRPFLKRCPNSGKIIGLHFENMPKWLFPIFGVTALLWVLLRVLPKPSRAAYPCMKVAAPLASTFIVWLVGFSGSFFLFRRARERWQHSKKLAAGILVFVAALVFTLTNVSTHSSVYSGERLDLADPYGPNNPVGQSKGIFPGRVVWAWDPDATNENCRPDRWGDGYFLDKNCDQAVVDRMLAEALLKLTEAPSEETAWDAVFRYFNQNHGKGDVGYQDAETIFIKINAVHAWTTNNDGSIRNDGNYGNVDTSPQAVLAMLRQLVNKAGVPQENIYIGDPYTHIFNHCLKTWRSEFPNIHYLDKSGRDGRERLTEDDTPRMFFSDKGTVLEESEDNFYKEMLDADYLLNIPAMKGHRWGGVTLFGKNFFGANTRYGAGHMHPGLHRTHEDDPLRGRYGMYRVFVDLMGHEDLGDKTLIYFMDALWSCSYEHEPPVKFQMAPFHNDWTSSILLSLDPLAIESVCLDILQAEFPKTESEEEGNYWYPNFPACDDYLHQAADPANWPEGIVYDPEGDGTPLGSLGVHEHWNNPEDQLYSRNLGTGDGIELVKLFATTAVAQHPSMPSGMRLAQNYPNPFNPSTQIEYQIDRAAPVQLTVYNAVGQAVKHLVHEYQPAGAHAATWNGRYADGTPAPAGTYFYTLRVEDGESDSQLSRRMILVK